MVAEGTARAGGPPGRAEADAPAVGAATAADLAAPAPAAVAPGLTLDPGLPRTAAEAPPAGRATWMPFDAQGRAAAALAAWGPVEGLAAARGLEAAARASFRPARAGGAVGAGAPTADEGGWRLVDTLGQGGAGVVYRALQPGLEREVALKVALDPDPARSASFLAEARVTGYLEHAHVVPVHALDRDPRGALRYAMKLVAGRSWAAQLAAGEPSLRERVRTLIAVCHAVAFAHQRGVLHRDLKPANVMVGEFGQVYVVDWGLAAALDRDVAARLGIPHVDDARVACGTPAYLAPEQAVGERPDARTDVYLLGACLHEALTGAPPHRGARLTELLTQALLSEPATYGPEVPAELARIAHRARRADPAERFPSVEALRAALEGFLEHEQAGRLAGEALARVERLRALVAAPAPGDGPARAARERAIRDAYSEARFAAGQALAVWPEAPEARQALAGARDAMARHAAATDDAPLARSLLDEAEDPALRAALEATLARVAARDAELALLRDRARRQDWSAVAPPLSNLFVVAGVLGAVCFGLTGRAWAAGAAAPWAPGLVTGAWLVVVATIGARAWRMRADLPENVASAALVAAWAVVALACLLLGLLSELHGAPRPLALAAICLLVGAGVAGMAAHTRRWLLLPTAGWFVGAPLVAAAGARAFDAMAALWLVVLAGSGLAFRLGASLDPYAADARPTSAT